MAKKFVNEKTGTKTVMLECNGRYFMRYYEHFRSCGWRLVGGMEEVSKEDYDNFQEGYIAP